MTDDQSSVFETKPEAKGHNRIDVTVLKWSRGKCLAPHAIPEGHPLNPEVGKMSERAGFDEIWWPPQIPSNTLYKAFCWDHDCSTPSESLNFCLFRNDKGEIDRIRYSNDHQEGGADLYTSAFIIAGFWENAEPEVSRWICDWLQRHWDADDKSSAEWCRKNGKDPFPKNDGYDHTDIDGWYTHQYLHADYGLEDQVRNGNIPFDQIDWAQYALITGESEADLVWQKKTLQALAPKSEEE